MFDETFVTHSLNYIVELVVLVVWRRSWLQMSVQRPGIVREFFVLFLGPSSPDAALIPQIRL